MIRPSWDFDYRPINAAVPQQDPELEDWILASEGPIDPAELSQLFGHRSPELRVDPVLDWHPLYWTRIRTGQGLPRAWCERVLRTSRVQVRYLCSTRAGSQRLPPTLELSGCLPMRARHWRVRSRTPVDEATTAGRWFVGPHGVEVDRQACGTAAGTRLAVIDNDAGEVDRLDLDNHFLVGIEQVSYGSSHAASLIAWAVSARDDGGRRFVGIAPDASPRLYSIAKPGEDVLSFPLAIVRAVSDGADVVVCATNVDGQWSPMLDDALEVACRLGRGGKGTAVVLPCGRETSSPEGSVHSSLSLGAGDPASDPRVFCVAPSGRDGGWFLWRDRRGRLHPFANRGPALRWLAPGDDVALPFGSSGALAHAESSGASAMAAGVLLLVLGRNPALTLPEIEDAVTRTVREVEPQPVDARSEVADPADILPLGRDRDGHNAKHGYGRLQASRACLAVSDPVGSILVSMGEERAALRWAKVRDGHTDSRPSARDLCTWAARVALADAGFRHSVATLLRHLRLLALQPERLRDQSPGALLRCVAMLLRDLPRSRHAPATEEAVRSELETVDGWVRDAMLDPARTASVEGWLCDLATSLWPATELRRDEKEATSLSPTVELLGA